MVKMKETKLGKLSALKEEACKRGSRAGGGGGAALTGRRKSTWSTSRKQGICPANAYAVEKASSNARCIRNPPKILPWMFLC